MKRGPLRGLTLIEALAALLIVAGVLALMGGFVFQVARASDQTQRHAANPSRDFLALLEARLEHIVLVADPNRPRVPLFEVRPDRLAFVTRFVPPAGQVGLTYIEIVADADVATITLTSWPRATQTSRVTQAAPGLRFAATDTKAAVGIPTGITVTLDGGAATVVPLGTQLPLDCVFTQRATAPRSAGLPCPGVLP